MGFFIGFFCGVWCLVEVMEVDIGEFVFKFCMGECGNNE